MSSSQDLIKRSANAPSFFNFLILILLSGCSQGVFGLRYGGDSLPPKAKANKPSQKNAVDFEKVNQQVFIPYCLKCHESSDEPILVTYEDYIRNLSKIENTVIHTKEMPRRKQLSSTEIEIVKQWIDGGAVDKWPAENSQPQGENMKKTMFAAVLMASSVSFAHGNLAQQAHDAVTSSLKMFQTEEVASLRQFRGISAVLVARETFDITITLADGTTVNHQCIENEDVEPVVWECTKK